MTYLYVLSMPTNTKQQLCIKPTGFLVIINGKLGENYFIIDSHLLTHLYPTLELTCMVQKGTDTTNM